MTPAPSPGWQDNPAAVAFVTQVRRIDGKLADAIITALAGGYTLEQVRKVCQVGGMIAKGKP
jgi:hypothetical protein